MGWKAICLMIKKGNIFAFQAISAPIFRYNQRNLRFYFLEFKSFPFHSEILKMGIIQDSINYKEG